MSIFRCGICEQHKDADLDGCEMHPSNEWMNVCEICIENFDYEPIDKTEAVNE